MQQRVRVDERVPAAGRCVCRQIRAREADAAREAAALGIGARELQHRVRAVDAVDRELRQSARHAERDVAGPAAEIERHTAQFVRTRALA